ncbi:hypothetical protein QBA57_28590 [Streptomyces scabiei]|uniref:hypothetical protein n=1 Tax=Streptomyces scabiei TaxID=1930 RepID=UPI001B31D824|nr:MULTISPECIES: hypothetical protein [Streptomyces]MBP5883172.1 hypothetical protein [Streptomyces sp. LBUM 1487]MDX2626813.1 hypothetical protein [Streptomyces scabiei]MDX3162750.1 hypothetical protein [Streptomyces scabiei]
MARIYATSAEYAAYTGQTPPSDIDQQLKNASRMLVAEVFRLCWYEVDEDGYPSNTLVAEAFSDAVCAQVEWWDEIGDSTGAAAVTWGTVKLGSAQLSRSVTATSGADSAAREVAPKAWDALRSDDLTPDIFRLGAVTS